MRGSYSHMLLKVEMITITPDNPFRYCKGIMGVICRLAFIYGGLITDNAACYVHIA